MKDFHDLYSMISSAALPSFKSLEKIIRMVFEHRETELFLPISYQEDEINRMQNFWSEYLENLRAENVQTLPPLFSELIIKINQWLQLNTKLIS